MGKISSYANNPTPGAQVEFLTTDPANLSMSSTGTTETVTGGQVSAMASPDIPRVMFFGTSNTSGYQTVEGGERWTDRVCSALHAEQVNYGATGAILAVDGTATNGGYAQIWNALTPRVASAGAYNVRNASPYVPLSPVVVLDFGYNDIAWLSATLSTSITWWEMATQACCCIARAGGWFPDTDASVAYSATWTAFTNQELYGWPTSHGTASVGQTVTISVPADFPGGEICLLTVAYAGGAKWSAVVDGGSAQVLDGTGSKYGSSATHGNIVVQRLQGLAAGAHTIVVTVAAIDGGAEAIFGGWTITSPDLPLVVLANSPYSPDLPAAVPGAPHTPITVSDLTTLNASFATITAEFPDGMVVTADAATALANAGCDVVSTAPGSGYASDNSHLNAHGHAVYAQAVLAAIRSAPLPGFGRAAAMGILMRQINGPLEPALSANWSVTGGSAAWFGVDRAGNGVLRMQVTKSSSGVFGETIFSLPAGYEPDSFSVLSGASWQSGFSGINGAAIVGITSAGAVTWLGGDPTVDLDICGTWPANGLGF